MIPSYLCLADGSTPAGPDQPRWRTVVRNMVFFFAVLIGFEWVVDRLESPFQGADKVEKKFAYFAAHKDEFDFVFIGSSRVMNQISPRLFDREMAAAGRPCRSINLGYAAMFLPESAFLIERVRALHPARLRGMLVELSSPTPRHDAQHPLMAREIYWHGPVGTALACAAVLTETSSTYSAAERREQLWRQGAIYARCLLHLDSGLTLLDHLRTLGNRRSKRRLATPDLLGPDRDGFFPLRTLLGQGEAGAVKTGGSTQDLQGFEDNVAALRAEEAAPLPAPAPPALGFALGQKILRDVMERQVRALRASRIEPVYFIGPGTTREQPFLDLAARGVVPRLFAFNDPVAYPELYRPDMRADRYHLSPRGAELLTHLLVQRLTAPATRPTRE